MLGKLLGACSVAFGVLAVTDAGFALKPDTTAFDRTTLNTERNELKEMQGTPNILACELSDAPDAGDLCASIESMELICDVDRSRLRARVDSELPPCTKLRLVADDSFYRDTRVRWAGRAWAWWQNPTLGEHEICVDGCGICATVTCACTSDDDCDDGLFCNGQETCDADTGECVPGGIPCSACDTCDEDNNVCAGPPDDLSYVYRTGGALNGHPIDVDHSKISVIAGGQITGSILVETYNTMGPGSVAPLGWTVDWGLREDQPRLTDAWIPTGTSDHQIDIDVTAPQEPGDYHIIVAFAGRYTIDQVMSETKQNVPENPVWYDGNDVGFDWTEAQFETAVSDGIACSSVLYSYPDGYGHHWLPTTVVTVRVTSCRDDADCDDADACTDDVCNPDTGVCSNEPTECGIGEICIDGECVREPCSNDNLIHTTDALSVPRTGIAATTVGDRAFFAAGFSGSGPGRPEFDLVDVYNATTDTWSTDNLSFGRDYLAALSLCGKAIFAGGFFMDGSVDNGHSNRVDIYDSATDSWSTATLSIGRELIGATVVGDKAMFAGGHGENYLRTSRVDIYDCGTDTWSTAELSQGREFPGATTVGNKAIFAGGRPDHYAVTDRVDVYDFDTDTWSVDTPLSLGRMGIAATTVCNKAIFAGGYYRSGSTWVSTDRVDIYDLDTDTWTTATLSQSRGFAQATAVGSKAVFAGGDSGSSWASSDVVDVYDCETNTWSTAPPLSSARSSMAATTVAGRAMFAGGGGAVGSVDTIDIYSLSMEDCNNNCIPDEEDLTECDGSPWCSDCNGDGVIDECGISGGTTPDCNANGIPDECEGLDDSNPLAHWSFDAAADPGHDDSGNGHNGTVFGTTWTDAALAFDGVDDQVVVTSTPDLKLGGSFTIAARVYPTATPPARSYGTHSHILSKSNSDYYGGGRNYELDYTRDTADRGFFIVSGGTVGGVYSDLSYLTHQWYYVTGVYDADAQEHRIYVDGQLAGTRSNAGQALITPNDAPLVIGYGEVAAHFFHFEGTIDDVRVYDRVLTPAEISDIASGNANDCNGNGILDGCDLADCDGSEWCSDSNGNGVIDACDSLPAEKIVLTAQVTAGDQGDVYSMNPDGTALTNLTADLDAAARYLAISPDGRHVAFSAGSAYSWDIWVMNADGSNKTIVQSGLVSRPRWYNDTTLFYLRTLTTSCPFSVEIRSIEFDGAQWANDALVVSNAASIGQNTTESFTISPDRTMLVWAAQIGCWSPTYDIYMCDLDGTVCTNPRPFYADAGNDQMDTDPVWSHDGQTIYWRHDATPGVDMEKAIVMKAIDSPLPVTDYDAVVRPAGVDGNQLLGPFDLSPDDSRLLFYSNVRDGLYTWDLGVADPVDTLLLSANAMGGASWGLLDTSP